MLSVWAVKLFVKFINYMSRLGKLPIKIPTGVQVKVQPGLFTAHGPKGEVNQVLPRAVEVKQEGETLVVSVKNPADRKERALWGLGRQLVANAVKGAHENFTIRLEISGIGFKAQMEGKDLILNLGFSHPIRYQVPADITVAVDKSAIIVSGATKQIVGQVAAEIRRFKQPEPYKGKGIRYSDEVVRRKAGKVVKSAGAK